MSGIDVFSTFLTLIWKGLELPCSEITYGHDKRLAEHAVTYHAGTLVRNLGSNSDRFNYTIPLHQNLRGRWANSFSERFPELIRLAKENNEGELNDPIHGPRDTYLVQLGYTATNEAGRGGINVTLSFIEATEIGDSTEPEPLTLDAARVEAAAFGASLKRIVYQEDLTEGSPLDILNAPHVFASQVMRNVNKVAATMDAFANKMDRTRAAIEEVRDVRNWPVIASAKRLSRAAKDASLSAIHATPERKRIRTHYVSADIGLAQLAAQLGTSQPKLLERNEALTGSPQVKAGTLVFYEE